MKAAFIQAFGGPDRVTVGDAKLRAPQADEIVVCVEAAAINPLDLKIIAGYMEQVFPIERPYVPGTDFSGVVESVGAQATHLKAGDRVVGRTAPGAGGALAKQVVIAASGVVLMPPGMSFEQGAALPTVFGTASQALFDIGELKQGETVLIHAAAGGVGSMAVQLAHEAGARVIATASERNHDLVRSLGAGDVIDYRTQDVSQLRGIDLVIDTIGGDTLAKSWAVLDAGGRIATTVEFGIQARDGHAGTFVFFGDAARHLPVAFRMFEAGRLQIVTDTIFRFDEARTALERLATGHARGKLIVRVGE
jgi:NADPH:quinone reductase-like Zn-dependent oxidoreductase